MDIINQTDAVESFDGEAKLGKFMVQLSILNNLGTVELFVMPYFRKRVFPGRKGRLRPGDAMDIVIDSRDFDFESGAGSGRLSPHDCPIILDLWILDYPTSMEPEENR